MEVRIKSVNGSSPLPANLQMDVVYKAVRIDANRMKVTCDDGQGLQQAFQNLVIWAIGVNGKF